MCRVGESFVIDALSFADEFIESYDQRIKPRLSDVAFKRRMDERYNDLRREYREDYEAMKSLLERAPTSAAQPSISPLRVPNSPSGARVEYSTNGSTMSPFKS